MISRRVALVTGASRGIGRAIAQSLAGAHFDLMISGREAASLHVVADQLRGFGGTVDIALADMASEEDVIALSDAFVELHPAVDVLALAAGVGRSGPFHSFSLQSLDTQIAVNFRGPFLLVQRLLPALRAASVARPQTGAKVVAIASLTGSASEPALAAYAASKAALISLCQSITAEEGRHGVTATALSPGYVDTDMTEWVHDRVAPEHMITPGDLAELTLSISRLSRNAAITNIMISRPGPSLWRA